MRLIRKSLIWEHPAGFDSIQGLLDYAHNYALHRLDGLVICFNKEEINNFNSPYHNFKELEKEGYIKIEWRTAENNPSLECIYQIDLTVKGKIYYEELKKKTIIGSTRERAKTIFWAIVSSAITAYLVIKLGLK
ncbi:hypothetical protein [Larkinella arboricola]|nr:hypothetical protein [Larkinella arboricola]